MSVAGEIPFAALSRAHTDPNVGGKTRGLLKWIYKMNPARDPKRGGGLLKGVPLKGAYTQIP